MLRSRIDIALTQAEETFNQLTDSESQWWPFGFLKPRAAARFSTRRAAVLAILQGIPIGLCLLLVDGVARHAAARNRLSEFLLIVCAVVFATNRFTLAYFWNRRAERLAKHDARLRTFKAGG
jgi:hypothetical protein